jgi:hypothetical protein
LYVTAVDDLGNKATLPPIVFHVDDTGPAITKDIGDPQYMNGYWIETTTPITLTGNDNVGPCVSGVMQIHFDINGDYYIASGTSFTFAFGDFGYGEGIYTLEFWAVDNLGNVGPSTIQEHAIDDDAPVSYKEFNGPICGNVPPIPGWQLLKTYELMGEYPETWHNDVVDLSMYAGETIQLAWRYYSDDEYLGAIDDVTILEDGMVVYSEDFDSYSDDGYYTPGPFPPGWTTEGYGTPCYSSLKWWGAESYKRHSYPNSMACYYNCPNDDWVITPEFTFDEESEYALDYWYFHDDSWDIYLDLYVQLILGEPSGEPEGPVWITSDTEICFSSFDTASGTESLYIEVWWDSDNNGTVDTMTDIRYIEDNNPNDADPEVGKISYCMTLDEECTHEIYYYATDYFGHMEEMHMEIDHVDNTPPLVNKSFEGLGTLDYLFLNNETVITLEATDLPEPYNETAGRAIIEDFEQGPPWPWSPWVEAKVSTSDAENTGTFGGTVTGAAAHDGSYGILDPDWAYRTDIVMGNPGDKFSCWTRNTGTWSRTYFGFSATPGGCFSFVAGFNTANIIIQRNSGWGYASLVESPQSWQMNKWYRMEVVFDSTTDVTCNLYDSDGTTLLNSVSYSGITGLPAGIAMRGFGGVHIDTIETPGADGPVAEGCASGVILIEYRIWNETAGWGPWITYWNLSGGGTGPFTFAEGCTHYLQYRAVDCLGNTLLCEDDLEDDEELRGGYPGKLDPGVLTARDNTGIVILEPHIPVTYDRDDVVVLEEGFNTAVPPSGWTLIQYSVPPNPYTWGMDTYNPYEGSGYASCEYDPGYTSTQDEWLISPSFSLDGLVDCELSFAWFSSYYWGFDPYNNYDLEVYASSNGGSSWDFLWYEDEEDPWINWEWNPKTLDLSAYDGETDVQIALVYYGYDGAQGAFDAIMVTGDDGGAPPPPPPEEELNITVYNQTHYVDLEPPMSWITLELDHDGNMITPYTEFTIWQEDFACGQPLGSQCCKIHYRIMGPKGQMYYTLDQKYVEVSDTWHMGDAGLDTPISFQIRDATGHIKAGKYIVEFYAEDCLGNVEQTVHRHFYFPDTKAPTTTLLFTGPTFSDDGYDWISSSTKITLASIDVDSGVNSIYYRIDDGTERIYTAPFTLSGDGLHTIEYYARDMVGQAEDVQTRVVMLDSSGPDTGVSFSGDTYETSTVTWITDGTTVSIASDDVGCGLDEVYYRLDGGSWQSYRDSFALVEGSYLLECYGVDRLGNSGSVQSLAMGVDSSAPSVTYESPQASHLYIAGREIMVLPRSMDVDAVIIGPTSISARASDNGVGVQKMELYIDGELRYSSMGNNLDFVWNQRTFLQHTLEIVTVDFFGYRSSKTLDLWIFNL